MNKISTPLGITIIIVAAFLVGGGTLAYQYWWLPKHETNPPELTLKSETAKITVLSPNGGETWEIGKSYDINWQEKNLSAGTITVSLIESITKKR